MLQLDCTLIQCSLTCTLLMCNLNCFSVLEPNVPYSHDLIRVKYVLPALRLLRTRCIAFTRKQMVAQDVSISLIAVLESNVPRSELRPGEMCPLRATVLPSLEVSQPKSLHAPILPRGVSRSFGLLCLSSVSAVGRRSPPTAAAAAPCAKRFPNFERNIDGFMHHNLPRGRISRGQAKQLKCALRLHYSAALLVVNHRRNFAINCA